MFYRNISCGVADFEVGLDLLHIRVSCNRARYHNSPPEENKNTAGSIEGNLSLFALNMIYLATRQRKRYLSPFWRCDLAVKAVDLCQRQQDNIHRST
jgi:hypothetical protein